MAEHADAPSVPRWLKKFFLLAFLAGAGWRVKEYAAWMPLRDYRVEAQSSALERRLWEVFPSRCIRFWPYMLKDSEGLRDFLERDMPVSVNTEMSRFGRFVTTIRWLAPWVKVSWQGRLWFISKDGRMWDLSETEMSVEEDPAFEEVVKGPVWRLPQTEETPLMPPAGVFSSPFATDIISDFLNEYQGRAWFRAVREIVWDHRAGMDLFRLKLEREKQNLEILIQRAKYAGQDLGAALDAIINRLSEEGGNHVIDATYEGKILLRDLPGGPKEGSTK